MDVSAIRHPHPDWVVCPFTGKRRFDTKKEAKTALVMVRRIPHTARKRRGRRPRKAEQHVIRCTGCMGLHLTSSGQR